MKIQEKRPELEKEWHPDNGDINSFTAGSGKKVLWKCRKCGHEWNATIANRTNGMPQ